MIERLEADGDYVRLHVGQRVRLMRARLGDLATASIRRNSCASIAPRSCVTI
jgi:hypothetical protein